SRTPAVFAASKQLSSKMSHPPNTMSSSDASGTKSLMRGDFLSVRLPSRIVPIWVSDPIGFASPRRMAITPAMVVVLTAPRPTSMMPSFPSAFSMFCAFFTTGRLYHPVTEGDVGWFRRSAPTEPLGVTMAGVKLGDRFLAVGVRDPALIAALAAKAGLTGEAHAIEADDARIEKARAAIEQEGALIDIASAPWKTWPFAAGSVDVAVVPNLLPSLSPEDRAHCVAETFRVLRP